MAERRIAACHPVRQEATQFLAYEAEAGWTDLILPIYLSNAPILENPNLRGKDNLARRPRERQYDDWREIALEPADSPKLKATVRQIAESIAAAAERANKSSPAPAIETSTPADTPQDVADKATSQREAELEAALAEKGAKLRAVEQERDDERERWHEERAAIQKSIEALQLETQAKFERLEGEQAVELRRLQ